MLAQSTCICPSTSVSVNSLLRRAQSPVTIHGVLLIRRTELRRLSFVCSPPCHILQSGRTGRGCRTKVPGVSAQAISGEIHPSDDVTSLAAWAKSGYCAR